MILKEIYRLSILELKEAGIKTAELDAQVLICFSLHVSREKFYLKQNDQLSPAEFKKIKFSIKKRAQNTPVAYILGCKEFYGIDFKVDKNVLIPRPETEHLVELAFDRIKYYESSIKDKNSLIHDSKYMLLDMGTGCGNIIITLAKNTKGQFFAADDSPGALKIARQNAKLHKVDNKIKFIQSDLFSKLKNQKFNLIIANLPYVPTSDNNEKSIQFEPKQAIFANNNGTDIIKRFLKDAPNYLFHNGTILLELDPRNAIDIETYAKKYFPNSKIKLSKDLAGFWRYLILES